MNHLKPVLVRVFCPEGRTSVTVPFFAIELQKYSEEDLDIHGELNLSAKNFKKFISEYWRR